MKMEYLTKDDICLINKMTADRHGGNFELPNNFHNENPLDYLIEAVEAEMFGNPLYPEMYDKAGLNMFNINGGHIFTDGNKRTALESALLFLKLNGYKLKEQLSKIQLNEKLIPSNGNLSNEILLEFALEVASSKHNLEEVQSWFKENIERI